MSSASKLVGLGKDTSSSTPSRSSTPTNIEKTDSVVNLTKPTLYSIYNESSFLNLSRDVYYDESTKAKLNMERNVEKDFDNAEIDIGASKTATDHHEKLPSLMHKLWIFAIKLIILSVFAYIYNELTRHIHNNHIPASNIFYDPSKVTNELLHNFIGKLHIYDGPKIYSTSSRIVALAIQGLVMGSIQPTMDKILPTVLTKRLLTSNPNPYHTTQNTNLMTDLIRSLVTFLGISYAVRRIEWSSFLQLSIIWSLLNPGLWLLLDGTISGFLSSFTIAAMACVGVYFSSYSLIQPLLSHKNDFIAIWVWVASFFFCGLIIFGKLGRCLSLL